MKASYHNLLRFFTGIYFVIFLEFIFLNSSAMRISNLSLAFFVFCATLTYPMLYLLPAALCSSVAIYISELVGGKIGYAAKWNRVAIYPLMTLVSGGTIFLLFVDHRIYSMFKFHINSFVINLVMTPGGIESMGNSETDSFFVFILFLVCVLIASGILNAANWSLKRFPINPAKEAKAYIAVFALLILLGFLERVEFAYYLYKNDPSIVKNSQKIFLYQPTRMAAIFKKMHLNQGARMTHLKVGGKASTLRYPLTPIELDDKLKKYNIVWLVAESWRADTLNKEIMPATTEFSKKAVYFHNHYSAGNGTRMALCGMFYGLYGNYWDTLLVNETPPVIMRVLQEENYQFDMYTSAKFTYPEFDKTIFSNIPKNRLHQSDGVGGFVNDRNNISSIISFIKHRDPKRPFMTFMFFESPHAPYTFPKECIVRKDYLHTFNYSTVDVAANIGKIKNRYLNSVNHLDSQLNRVYKFLEAEKLMNSTIVIVTGDHGEEFMEKGHWGHNESFHEEQVRSPLLIYVPGIPHKDIYYLSSHLDLSATVGALIGIANPPSDYSLGYDLFDKTRREYMVVSSWSRICYVGSEFKYQTSSTQNILDPDKITYINDSIPTKEQARRVNMSKVFDMLKNTVRFYKKGGVK